VEADFGRAGGDVVDGEHIEAKRNIFHVALGEKAPRCARNHMLLFRGDAEFRQRGKLIADRARAHFRKRQRFAVLAD